MDQCFEGFQWFDSKKVACLIMAPKALWQKNASMISAPQAFFMKHLNLLDSIDPLFCDAWPFRHPTDAARALKELYKRMEAEDEKRREIGLEIIDEINAVLAKEYKE